MKKGLFFILMSVLLALGACGGDDNSEEEPENENNDNNTVTEEEKVEDEIGKETEEINVEIKNNEGEAIGSALLTEEDEGVKIALDVTGLSEGPHGFHIHDRGMCEGENFEEAGGHLNIDDSAHGFDHEEGPHVGDMSNIVADEDGHIQTEVVNEMVTLKEGEPNTLKTEEGTSLVIHTGEDDEKSQPAGDAGKPFACGVISE